MTSEGRARTPRVSLGSRLTDLVFLLGVLAKGIDGVAELIGGVIMLVISPSQLKHTASVLTAKELSEDPDDLLANLIVHGATHLQTQSDLFIGLFLLLHGLVKIAIVTALVLGSRRVYPWAIGALLLFLVYQGYEIIVAPSPFMIALTLLDIVIVVLTWREWRAHRTLRDTFRSTRDWMLRG